MNTDQFETLVVATFYLLSRFQKKQDVLAATRIVNHLEMLLLEPKVQQSPLLKNSCTTLLAEWREAVGSYAEPKAEPKSWGRPVNTSRLIN